MVGTGGADIHLLQQAEVGVLLLQVPGDSVQVGRQALFDQARDSVPPSMKKP